MDIVTHAMMGVVASKAIYSDDPLAGVLFVSGSVLPDLDALSRLFGKRAFLMAHQTWSHSLAGVFVAGLVTACGMGSLPFISASVAFKFALAVSLGMSFHILLDLTNSYGTALLLPFSSTRFCLDWVFFIDVVVILASALALVGGLVFPEQDFLLSIGFLVFSGLYWGFKAVLHRRVMVRLPDCEHAIPCGFRPWLYFCCQPSSECVCQFQVNAFSLEPIDSTSVKIEDQRFSDFLDSDADWRTMRSLSKAYHLVDVKETDLGVQLRAKDLRIQNFQTRFGELEWELDESQVVVSKVFHV